ncbi:MAG: AAA family ATPase [Fimbriimonadaceae bacterium]
MSSSSSVSRLDRLRGLRSAKRTLAGLFSKESGAHAVLLYGARGSGKTTLARILAQYWLCRQPSPAGACGECRSCLSFAGGKSADVLEITPTGPANLIRLGAISSSKEEDYALQFFLRTPPLAARGKVVLIEHADRMTPDAANALLKILEEPPPYARFVLTTSAVGAIRATIRSRCLTVACELPEDDRPDDPDWLRVLAAGSPGEAERLARFEGPYRKIWDLAVRIARPPHASARRQSGLRWAEEFRSIADELHEASGDTARNCQAEALQALASLLTHLECRAEVPAVIEAHRRIVGNGQAALVTDALFAEIAVASALRPAAVE